MFGAQFLTGLANWWEIAIFAIGVVLIMLEIFVIPGFGVAGISGICLCIIALLAMLIPNAPTEIPIPSTDIDWAYFNNTAMAICIAFVAAIIAMGLLSRVLPKWSLMTKSHLILSEAKSVSGPPRSADSPMLKIQPGDTGTVVAQLHPVGEVQFGNDLLDAVSDSGIIDSGTKVRVVTRDGNRIIVEPVNPTGDTV
jgi:membrane-bound serine protease (ClpP class)